MTVAPVIEKIPNDVEIEGDLTVNGSLLGADGQPIGGGGLALPPDPYEGALLGWLNGQLAWIGTPPIEIPEGVFGPITSWDPSSGVIEVEGTLPGAITTGVYVWQVDAEGNNYTSDFLVSADYPGEVSGSGSISNPEQMFDGTTSYASVSTGTSASMRWTPSAPINYISKVEVSGRNGQSGGGEWKVNRGQPGTITVPGQDNTDWVTLNTGSGTLYNIDLSTSSGGCKWGGIRIDGKVLILPQYSNNFRVQQIIGDNKIVGVAVPDGANFIPGKYLKVPAQRVAPWVAASRRLEGPDAGMLNLP